MCEARYQRPNSKNAKFINMQHSPFPVSLPTSKTKWRQKAPTMYFPAHLTSPHIAPLWKKYNKQRTFYQKPTNGWIFTSTCPPHSLPTLSRSVNPTSLQARLRAPVRARADGRDLALDGFARELLAEGCVHEGEGEPAREDLPDVEGAGVVGGEGRDELGVCAACCCLMC